MCLGYYLSPASSPPPASIAIQVHGESDHPVRSLRLLTSQNRHQSSRASLCWMEKQSRQILCETTARWSQPADERFCQGKRCILGRALLLVSSSIIHSIVSSDPRKVTRCDRLSWNFMFTPSTRSLVMTLSVQHKGISSRFLRKGGPEVCSIHRTEGDFVLISSMTSNHPRTL